MNKKLTKQQKIADWKRKKRLRARQERQEYAYQMQLGQRIKEQL